MGEHGLATAWCEEIDAIVDIVQARQAYFQQPRPRRRFTFRCPDPRCRSETGALIVGVNYDKAPEMHQYRKAPHFKKVRSEDHRLGCPYLSTDMPHKQDVDPEDQGRELPRKLQAWPTIFKAPADGEDEDPNGRRVRRLKNPAVVQGCPGEQEGRPPRSSTSTESEDVKTRYFRDIVHAFEQHRDRKSLNRERLTLIGVEEPTRTYREWFRWIDFAVASNQPKIWYGSGTLKDVSSGYQIYCSVRRSDDPEIRSARLQLDSERLRRSPAGRKLAAVCSEIGTGGRVYFYVLGQAFITQKRCEIDIRCRSLVTVHIERLRKWSPSLPS